MIGHLKVLDLTDDRGLLCGRLLADLGADVVQVEPAAGSTARRSAPLVPPAAGRGDEVSLVWETFGANRRGVSLDLDGATGQERFRRLARAADVVVTSMPRQWLTDRGLDPARLRDQDPTLVCVTITGFGWDGPKAGYADTDLVVWAAGGPLEPHRDGGRPPLRISVPQAYLHAGADAAAGALTAVLARARTGVGQVVDVSAQVSAAAATLARVLATAVGDANPEWQKQPLVRTDQSGSGAATPNSLKKWHCADGIVELHLSMGPAAGAFTNRLFAWIAEEGLLPGDVATWDWRTVPDRFTAGDLTTDDLERARAAVRSFLLTRTKEQVVAASLERRLLAMAIYDSADVLASRHLADRGFWSTLEVAGVEVRVPGVLAQVTGGPGPSLRRPAPRLGEHTDEVLAEWLPLARPVVDESTSSTVPRPSAPAGDARGALSGLKVLDLSWVVAGPLIGRQLADFGAEVVRVESSTRVETARLMQPFHRGEQHLEGSALFGNCNAGKWGLTLDLKSPEGQGVARDLVAWADVVVESFSPGQLAKWGLDPATLRAERPDLVVVSTSIAGQSGPWSRLAGYGNVGSSLSGFQHLVGWPDRLPLGPFGPYTDYVGPRLALPALLAALERRRLTGEGCYVDLSQVEAGVFFLSPQVAHAAYDGTVAERRGNADATMAPHGVHACRPEDGRDRFVAVVVRHERDWCALAATIQRPDLAARSELLTAAGRLAVADELEAAVSAWTADRSATEVEHLLQAAGVPAHVASSSADFLTDPQLTYRGHLVQLPSGRHGTTYVEGPRWQLSATPGGPRRAAPSLGQHNEHVLRTLLGYEAERVAALTQKGVLA
ncbi:CaiB/BaiF CoA-transferase family protein [Nocardioides campestrisoli]|uniref:CaiB/BaiF CoA-transferase family protein n=1 Tax=Nocardioides campestrisoli TaxID=2736757 RepID=UPI0015E71BF9|nr:CoA transferase [Nocardioides campestrisoli]